MDPVLSYFTYIPIALKILRSVVASEGEVGSGDQPRVRRQGNFIELKMGYMLKVVRIDVRTHLAILF